MRFGFNRSTLITTVLILSLYGQIPGTPLGLSASLATQDKNAMSRRSLQDRKAEAERLHREGIGQFDAEEFAAALQKFQQALAIYKEIGDKAATGRTLNNIGMVYERLQQPDRAIASLQQALTINRKVGNTKGEWRTLFNIGQVYENRGYINQAQDTYRQVLAVSQASGDSAAAEDKISNETGFGSELIAVPDIS